MYEFPLALVFGGLGVGLSYVFIGGICYFLGYRRDHPRLKTFGNVLLTRSPACILGVALAYVLLATGVGVLWLVAVALAGIGALVPPLWALVLTLDDEALERTAA